MSIFKRLTEKLEERKPKTLSAPQPEAIIAAQQYAQQGWVCRNRNDLEGAASNFRKAISLNPDTAEAYYGLGVVYCITGRYREGLADLGRAIALQPLFAPAYTERGLAYEEIGDNAKAMADFDEAAAIDPAYVLVHVNKSALYARQGNYAAALTSSDLAVRLDPQYAISYLNDATISSNRGDNQRAIDDFETYLKLDPDGPHAQYARTELQQLRPKVTTPPVAVWSIERRMWREFVVLSPQSTIDELVKRVQEGGAYYVVVGLPDRQYAVASVYARGGLRPRLTEIADAIGRDILSLRLDQFFDLWRPCNPVTPDISQESAAELCDQNQGRTVVLDGDLVIGVLDNYWSASPLPEFFNVDPDMVELVHARLRPSHPYPELPTVLFGRNYQFGREDRPYGPKGSRRCRKCNAEFAYFKPVLDQEILIDYACPQCGESPVFGWIETRMQSSTWSRYSFLGAGETLEDVIAEDAATLQRLGTSHERIADALCQLLDTATAAYKRNPRRFGSSWQDGTEPNTLPPEDVGLIVNNYQILLQVYSGYWLCPWSAPQRPWNSEKPSVPLKVKGLTVTTQAGQALHCQGDMEYRFGDREFIIVNRTTQEQVRGLGLMVHLIRDHHFFGGKQSAYRVEPEQLVRVLQQA